MALVTRFLLNKHSKQPTNDVHIADSTIGHLNQLLNISSSWKRKFSSKQSQPKGVWVPSMSGMVKAGDEGLFTSTLFANIHGHPGEPSLEALYELFAEQLRSRPIAERSAYTGEIAKFLSSTKRVTSGPKRVQSLSRKASNRRSTDISMIGQRKSMDISTAERGLSRSISMKRPTSPLAPMKSGLVGMGSNNATKTSWTTDGRISDSRYGIIGIEVTSAELAALSILLGSPLAVSGEPVAHSEKGALNISISISAMQDGRHQINLRQHKQNISHMPAARGSGFSPLYSKHLAAGSLPYLQDEKTVRSILVSDYTLKIVESGSSLYLHDSYSKTTQTQFLSALPSSRELSFEIVSASTQPLPFNPIIDAISLLPFVGGLVPLASMPLVKTVQFVAFGGLPPARLLQRLEGLVDKVNRHTPHLQLFGPLYESQNIALLYRERERLGKLATDAKPADSIADKASRMQRYITLLARLTTLIPGMLTQDAAEAVQAATKREIERSYHDAVAVHNVNRSRSSSVVDSYACSECGARSKRFSTQTYSRSNRSSDFSMVTAASPTTSASSAPHSLGKQVERLLKSELPLSVEDVALAARLVIAAWTLSVETVAWEEGEQGFRVLDTSKLPEQMVLC
ncbi:hypothetical protein HBI25_143810 [Parastagonospora nodorum]|nr:hypothetical protein HBH51_074330 [Parastagonospora nodorum]KAH3982508.1 hypothetical protein HBH52_080150 [Parastagonospora nodorum]KAH4007878.1 hypothetical protein HBI10_002200 [Parastagonospora nodorum]KAH4016588.1 hypothetical protein HBI13_150210 [Parastagonospora nodorum]KAH4058617.1 hypothetical protein HBH49_035500 [Parastagonospora nodorum]